MSESLIFAQKVALTLGWLALIYAAFSMVMAVSFGWGGDTKARQSAEREAIGWFAVAALMWLVAK